MTDDESCPLCSEPLGPPHQIDVCTKCHSTLQLSGAIPVTTTGEFQAVIGPPKTMPSDGRIPSARTETSCCWCSKEPDAVRKMLSQSGYHICNECVALCADILRMELGDDFG